MPIFLVLRRMWTLEGQIPSTINSNALNSFAGNMLHGENMDFSTIFAVSSYFRTKLKDD